MVYDFFQNLDDYWFHQTELKRVKFNNQIGFCGLFFINWHGDYDLNENGKSAEVKVQEIIA